MSICRILYDAKIVSIGYTTSTAVKEILAQSRGMQQTDVHMVSVMSRYIDAEWLLNFFEPYPNDYQTPLGLLRACVDDAPSIDIVRCKECKSYDTEAYQNGYGYCSNHMSVLEDNDFCSYGERKESE